MLKIRTLRLIVLALLPFLVFGDETNLSQISLPVDLQYEGKPIPTAILEDFFTTAVYAESDFKLDIPKNIAAYEQKIHAVNHLEEKVESEECDELEVDCELDYLGTLYKKFHLIRAYAWPKGAMGKFTGILIFKREGDLLKIVDIIHGGDRHSSMITKSIQIQNNVIIFLQRTTTGMIVDEALKLYPELSDVRANSSNNFGYGEACFYGSFDKAAEINSSGKVEKISIVKFYPCEGCQHEAEIYEEGGLKALALYLLTDE
jgi:hypothetical protein